MTHQDSVLEFMIVGEQHVPVEPVLPSEEVLTLRLKLIHEELRELEAAFDSENLVDVADALADLLYVTYGAALATGIDIEPVFDAVHQSNMTKFPGGVVTRREDGKVLKPDDWEPPTAKIAALLKTQRKLYTTRTLRSRCGVEIKMQYVRESDHWRGEWNGVFVTLRETPATGVVAARCNVRVGPHECDHPLAEDAFSEALKKRREYSVHKAEADRA